jgi:type I restriction enzyme S subunit
MIKIGDKVDISNGYAFKSSKYVEQGIRVVRITNVQKGQILDDNPKFYSSDTKEELKSYLINEGDILMSLTGNVGRVGVFPKEFCPAYLNQRVARIRVKSQDLFQKYLFYMLNSEFFERDAIFNSSGIAQLNLSTKWVSEYKIPLPPLDQQKKIAAILDAADAYKQKTKTLLKKYDALTQSLFLDMFGDPVSNPKGWEIKSLSEFIKSLNTGVSVNSINKEYKEGDFGILKTSCVYSGIFRHSEAKVIREDEYERMRLSPKADSIIIIRMNTTELVGKSAYIKNDHNNLFLPDRLWQTEKAELSYDVRWLSHALSFQSFSNEIGKISSGTSGSMKNISKKNYLKLPMIYPPKKLQNQFADSVKAIEAQKGQAQASLAQAEDLFKSLLQRAFKGELTANTSPVIDTF